MPIRHPKILKVDIIVFRIEQLIRLGFELTTICSIPRKAYKPEYAIYQDGLISD